MTTNRKRKKTEAQLSLWAKLPVWAWQQGLRNNVDFTAHPDSAAAPLESQRQPPSMCADIKQAQVITSRIEYPQTTGDHRPVLDIDFPCAVVPSTTPGHFHLYLDKELEWDTYRKLLDALAEAGIIETGYRDASIARGYTSVRLPWVKKPAPEALAPAAAAPASAPATEAPREQPAPMPPRNDFRVGEDIEPGAPVTIAPTAWSSPGADPLGDIIEFADRMRAAPTRPTTDGGWLDRPRTNLIPNPSPIQQSFGNVTPSPIAPRVAFASNPEARPTVLTYNDATMSYSDDLGRSMTAAQVRRAVGDLGIERTPLDGPNFLATWERLLTHQRAIRDERAVELTRIERNRFEREALRQANDHASSRIQREAGRGRRSSFRGLGRDDVMIVDEVAPRALGDLADEELEAERILNQERADAAIAASIATMAPAVTAETVNSSTLWGRLGASLMGGSNAYTRAALRAEDQAVRDRIAATYAAPPPGTPLVVDWNIPS